MAVFFYLKTRIIHYTANFLYHWFEGNRHISPLERTNLPDGKG